jgi:hypothetical protein
VSFYRGKYISCTAVKKIEGWGKENFLVPRSDLRPILFSRTTLKGVLISESECSLDGLVMNRGEPQRPPVTVNAILDFSN